MKHLIALALILVAFVSGASTPSFPADEQPSEADRAKWMEEMKQHQNDFIAKELDLTAKQKADFLPLYNKMREETFQASRAARQKARAVRKKGDAATDADYEAATQAYLDFRTREAEIVKGYYKKFSHILSKKQLFKLDGAERKFDRMLMQHRPGKGRGNGRGPGDGRGSQKRK